MTRLYYEYTENKEAFRRIILAELMGEFKTLKYYPNDLNREISFPTTKQQQLLWQTNTAMETYGILVEEVDDYYSTPASGEVAILHMLILCGWSIPGMPALQF